MPHLGRWTEAREAAAKRYDALIEEHHLTRFLQRPTLRPNRKHVWNQYVVRVADGQRDALVRHLKADGIGCEIYYPVPLHLQECLAHLGHRAGEFPASEEAARCVLALPMFAELTADQQERVVGCVSNFVRHQGRAAA
jgi:dTDP-4-amino-4,6-dideoxygalactose transaminase